MTSHTSSGASNAETDCSGTSILVHYSATWSPSASADCSLANDPAVTSSSDILHTYPRATAESRPELKEDGLIHDCFRHSCGPNGDAPENRANLTDAEKEDNDWWFDCQPDSANLFSDDPAPLKSRRYANRPAAKRSRMRKWRLAELTRLIFQLTLLYCLINQGSTQSVDHSDVLPDLSKVPTPPRFVHDANSAVIYFVVHNTLPKDGAQVSDLKTATLSCRAEGFPQIRYRWTKNGRPFELNPENGRVSQVPGEGTRIVKKLRADDAGSYACFAENGNGTAVDKPIELRQTYLGFFERTEPEIIDVELGQPFHRSCEAPTSDPEPRVFWLLKNAGSDRQQFTTVNSSHIAMNDRGTIFFSYVAEDDMKHPQLFYTCAAANTVTKDYKFGKPFGLNVVKNIRSKLDAAIPPQELYTNNEDDLIGLRGQSVQLFCIFSGFPESMFTPNWERVGGTIDWVRTSYETNWQKSILIDDIDYADEGQYRCSFPENPAMDRDFNVVVQAAPYWLEPVRSVNSSEGETVTFVCNATGRPEPTFEFFKNGLPLRSDGGHVVIRGNTLTIVDLVAGKGNELFEGDNAVYQCKAENKHGSLWTNFYLNILSFKPYIEIPPGVVMGVVGETVSLRCKAFGSPQPAIEWNGEKIARIPTHRLKIGTEEGGTWSVFNISAVEGYEQGDYECHTRNKYGSASAWGKLTLKNATRIIHAPHSHTVIAGERVLFRCQAMHDADLRLELTWLFQGIPLQPEAHNMPPGVHVNLDNSLEIDHALKDHTGEYTCLAKTALDRRERSGMLVVKDVPQSPFGVWTHCADRSAVVHWSFIDNQVDTAPAESFAIQYNTNFEPEVWETYDFQPSVEHRQITVSLSPMGEYKFRVVARNEVGDSAPSDPSKSLCRAIPARPDTNPRNVVVKGNEPDNLIVYWEPMPKKEWNGENFHYEVRYRKADLNLADADEDSWRTDVVMDPEDDHLVIDSSIDGPYVNYEVQVRAVNELGPSAEAPRTVEGYSGEGKPLEAPVDFRLVATRAPTIATFEWQPIAPEIAQGNFLGYKITHWHDEPGRRSDPTKKEAYFDRNAQSGTVYDLKPFRTNHAYIQVINGAQAGPASELVSFDMEEGVPGPVRRFTGFPIADSIVGLVWMQPREHNGILYGYNLTWQKIEESGEELSPTNDVWQAIFTDPHTSYYRAAYLTPNTLYRFTMRALTKSGRANGDPTSVDVKTLPFGLTEGDPEMPSVQVMGVGEKEANVTWIPGRYDAETKKPMGDRFYFKYKLKSATAWNTVEPVGENFTVSLQDLYPGLPYEVKSVSVIGDKETESAPYEFTTLGKEPMGATAGWLVAIIVAIIILLIVLIIVCIVVRNRGAKYPARYPYPHQSVHQKEKMQGREVMMPDDKGFGEYAKGPTTDEEQKSLTGTASIASETDSMMDYADGEAGKFTEDGSFIGMYGPPSGRGHSYV